jgi:hypothetical protein
MKKVRTQKLLVAFKDMSNEDVLSLNLLRIQEKQLQLMVLNTQL